jgi:hypothetical protein
MKRRGLLLKAPRGTYLRADFHENEAHLGMTTQCSEMQGRILQIVATPRINVRTSLHQKSTT